MGFIFKRLCKIKGKVEILCLHTRTASPFVSIPYRAECSLKRVGPHWHLIITQFLWFILEFILGPCMLCTNFQWYVSSLSNTTVFPLPWKPSVFCSFIPPVIRPSQENTDLFIICTRLHFKEWYNTAIFVFLHLFTNTWVFSFMAWELICFQNKAMVNI